MIRDTDYRDLIEFATKFHQVIQRVTTSMEDHMIDQAYLYDLHQRFQIEPSTGILHDGVLMFAETNRGWIILHEKKGFYLSEEPPPIQVKKTTGSPSWRDTY